jgi:hypothetical protein
VQSKVRFTIALSVIVMSIISGSCMFVVSYGQVFEPSPLLNTNMSYWTTDPTKNITTPYLWTIDLIQGPTDNASVYQATVAGRRAVALRVERTNTNNSQIWTTIHVRQDLRGEALEAIFRSNISIDVYPTFQYLYDQDTKNPENAFGVEINDGTNLIWYIFANETNQVVQLPHHRIVVTQTPLNAWSTRQVDISSQYVAAGWKMPNSISFTLILGTTWLHPGDWVGYFSDLTVNVAPLRTQTLSSTQTTTVLVANVLVVIFLGGVIVGYGIRRNSERRRARDR